MNPCVDCNTNSACCPFMICLLAATFLRKPPTQPTLFRFLITYTWSAWSKLATTHSTFLKASGNFRQFEWRAALATGCKAQHGQTQLLMVWAHTHSDSQPPRLIENTGFLLHCCACGCSYTMQQQTCWTRRSTYRTQERCSL